MWRSVALAGLVGACSFRTHALSSDSAPGGEPMVVDAPHLAADGPPDTPPDACLDDDGDGICNVVDTWPCGAAPAAPGQTVTMTGNGTATRITITQIAVNGSQMVVAAPGSAISVAFHYAITDTACPSACIDQIEVGYVPGGRVRCMFDQTVSKSAGATGNTSTNIAAPSAAGSYDLRTNLGQNTSCGTTTQWWSSEPDDTRTIARLCVH